MNKYSCITEDVLESQMKLYGYRGVFNSEFFDTDEELSEWMKTEKLGFGIKCIIDYVGNVAGRNDVLKITEIGGLTYLVTACDEDGYGIYNEERSNRCNTFIWEYYHGNLSSMYKAFRDRGIVFENDIYKEIEDRNKRILKMAKEKNLFGLGGK